jgi:hypothetical protein
MTTSPGFDGGLVDGVELEEPTVIGTDLLFDVSIPPVGGEAVRSIRLPV